MECSIVRVGQTWRNQLAETGHIGRDSDLDAIAELGISRLRYPVLWEQVSPSSPKRTDFAWHDRRMARMRQLGIEPLVGLLHHGSGPSFTRLLDPNFPQLFADYARRVAERYPDVNDFTPINEPLTTARFSGLYGHWYPHKRSMSAFARMVVNQCRAICDAMLSIRQVTPHARLIQTEDLGRVFSTPLLAYQADYENERRWLTFDLLHGRVGRHHPWFGILAGNGIPETELDAFVDAPCAPDIIGINHYATSDRFLEHRPSRLPLGMRFGGNRRHRYADLEALRVQEVEHEVGPAKRLREAWNRYGRPMAITECHHGSTRDEQLRWLDETWRAAQSLREEGVSIRAVTMWAMFGLTDWKSLLLRHDFEYEPGAFDVRLNPPRLTALGKAARALAAGKRMQHPVLDMPGWWRRGQRFYHHSSTAFGDDRARGVLIAAVGHGVAPDLVSAARHRGLRPLPIVPSGDWVPSLIRTAETEKAWAIILDGSGPSFKITEAISLAVACHKADLDLVILLGEGAESHWVKRLEQAILLANPQALLLRCAPLRTETTTDFSRLIKGAEGSQADDLDRTHLSQAILDLLIDKPGGTWQVVPDASGRPHFAPAARNTAGSATHETAGHSPDAPGGDCFGTPLILAAGQVEGFPVMSAEETKKEAAAKEPDGAAA